MRAIRTRASSPGRSRRYQEAKTFAAEMSHHKIAEEGYPDLVFVHWRATATHEGQHQIHKHVRDIEPTGEEGTVSGISLYRIGAASLSSIGVIATSWSTPS